MEPPSAVTPPVLGRPSPAALAPIPLRPKGGGGDAAYRADAGASQWWALRVASVAGVRHRLTGRRGEDAYGWAVAGEALVVAVGDGVGSLAGSEEASAAAVDAVCQAVTAALSHGCTPGEADLRRALEGGFRAANRAVGGTKGATTLVAAVLMADGTVAAARVGDSTILVLIGDQWSELFAADPAGGVGGRPSGSGPTNEGAVSGATAALPVPPDLLGQDIEMAGAVLPTGAAVVLVTDGVADPWRDGPTTVAPSLAGLLGGEPSALDLVVWADFARQGCHDDRTILALWQTARRLHPGAPNAGVVTN